MRKLTAPCLFLLASAAALSAQPMSGTYTVDANSGNFASFAAAAAAVTSRGVSGPVEFVGQPGTYTGNWNLGPITGTSATNTVTFRSSVTTINQLKCKVSNPNGEIITMNGGTSYVTFDGLSFEQSTGPAIHMLYVSSGQLRCTFITVKNCVFNNGLLPSATYGVIRTNQVRNWQLLDCEFHITRTALYSQGSWDMYLAGNVFDNQSTQYCLSLWNSNRYRCLIYNNVFTGTVSRECVRVDLSHYGTDFFHNTFNVNMPAAGWLIDNSGCCSVWNRFFNNIFVVTGGGKGIRHRNVKDVELNNNLYFIASGVIGNYNNVDYTTLASWGRALGTYAQNGNNDANSVVGDPKFVANSAWELDPTSPAIGQSLPVPSTWTVGFEVTADQRGYLRGAKKDIGAFEVAGCKPYGEGCQGTAANVPDLTCSGNIWPGDTANLDLTNGRPSSTVFTVVGVSQVAVPLGGGCDLLVAPLLTFGAMTDASGAYTLAAPIPAATAVTGLSAYTQMGVVDPNAGGIGIALSNGLELRL